MPAILTLTHENCTNPYCELPLVRELAITTTLDDDGCGGVTHGDCDAVLMLMEAHPGMFRAEAAR